MPDIAMCPVESGVCPKSKDCYRHEDSGTLPDEGRQAYFKSLNPETCKYFVSSSGWRRKK
jgi:hypothetical protein